MAIEVEKSIYQKYAEFKVEFGKLPFTKSGENDRQGFKYFELADFSDIADEYLLKHGMVYIGPTWEKDNDGMLWVVANLYDLSGMQNITFRVPNEYSVHSNNPIQNMGGTVTYWERYMKSLAIGLCERDVVDAQDATKLENKKATAKQIDMIRGLYDEDNIAKMIAYYNVNSLEELSLSQASEAIKRKKK